MRITLRLLELARDSLLDDEYNYTNSELANAIMNLIDKYWKV